MVSTFFKTNLSDLDLPTLADMLAELTMEYSDCSRNDGTSAHASILRQYITDIQLAIDRKRPFLGKPATN